jgi:hypothetical protein
MSPFSLLKRLAAAAATAGAQYPSAKKIWSWCQLEGGGFWDVSHGELKELERLVAAGQQLPEKLQELVERR